MRTKQGFVLGFLNLCFTQKNKTKLCNIILFVTPSSLLSGRTLCVLSKRCRCTHSHWSQQPHCKGSAALSPCCHNPRYCCLQDRSLRLRCKEEGKYYIQYLDWGIILIFLHSQSQHWTQASFRCFCGPLWNFTSSSFLKPFFNYYYF